MREIARDYQHALRLIGANPGARFRVTDDGGIRKDTGLRLPSFGSRKVQQLRLDAEVGKALLQMFGRAATQEHAAGEEPVNPRQVAAAVRFIAAYDHHYGNLLASAHQAPGLLERSPSVPAPERPTDPGSRNLQKVQAALARQGLSARDYADHVETLHRVAGDFTPSQFQTVNAQTMGGGNVVFRSLYGDSRCFFEPTSEELVSFTDEKYRLSKKEVVAQATAELLDSKESWIASRLTPDTSRAELEQAWLDMLPVRAQMFEAGGDLGEIRQRMGPTAWSAMHDYLLNCHSRGLSAEQAMTPVRLWMGSSDQTVRQLCKADPKLEPDVDELRVLCQLVDKGLPLTDDQADTLMKYMPPPSS